MASVTLRNVSKVYPDGFRAVASVDLAIADREFVVLVGPSGCGKSTTLRMIAGLEEPSEGELWIGARDVTRVPAAERDIAMVFQSYALYPHMSVRANLAFGLQRRARHKSALLRLVSRDYRERARAEARSIAQRVEHAARTLAIEALLAKKPAELSGGQRQRVAVGRALVREPAAFLFDEPLSNLDAKLRLEMRAELKALHRRLRATAIYVTHDQEEAMTLGDRLVVMKDGVVQQVAPPAEVYARPANRFVASFVGTPPMSFVEARVEGEALVVDGQTLALPPARRAVLGAHAGRSVVLGLRPETLAPSAPSAPGLGAALAASVEQVEHLGDRRDVIYRLASGARLVGRIPHGAALAEGERVMLAVDLERAHLFEGTGDGARIGDGATRR